MIDEMFEFSTLDQANREILITMTGLVNWESPNHRHGCNRIHSFAGVDCQIQAIPPDAGI